MPMPISILIVQYGWCTRKILGNNMVKKYILAIICFSNVAVPKVKYKDHQDNCGFHQVKFFSYVKGIKIFFSLIYISTIHKIKIHGCFPRFLWTYFLFVALKSFSTLLALLCIPEADLRGLYQWVPLSLFLGFDQWEVSKDQGAGGERWGTYFSHSLLVLLKFWQWVHFSSMHIICFC